jgi:hypothetical protein
MKRTIRIEVRGCDASTHTVDRYTDREVKFLINLAQTINEASEYKCMPRMALEEGYPTEPTDGEPFDPSFDFKVTETIVKIGEE